MSTWPVYSCKECRHTLVGAFGADSLCTQCGGGCERADYDSDDEPDVWCLHVLIADPDYKRPSADSIVRFFSTKEAAEAALVGIKEKLLEDEDDDGRSLDERFQQWCDSCYSDSYMDIDPFWSDISLVQVED